MSRVAFTYGGRLKYDYIGAHVSHAARIEPITPSSRCFNGEVKREMNRPSIRIMKGLLRIPPKILNNGSPLKKLGRGL